MKSTARMPRTSTAPTGATTLGNGLASGAGARLVEDRPSQHDRTFAHYLLRLEHSVELIVAGKSEAHLPSPRRVASEKLTPQEARVLQVLAEGYSNQAIAAKLFVSDSTVRTHLRNINSKLDAHSRTQAIAVGRLLGMIR